VQFKQIVTMRCNISTQTNTNKSLATS